MSKFVYDGPVTSYGKMVSNNWHGETTASSKQKAINNLKYQFNKEANHIASVQIELNNKNIYEF